MPDPNALKAVVRRQLMVHEGARRQVYLDTTGHKTVGVGFNMDKPDAMVIFEKLEIPGFQSVYSGQRLLNLKEIHALLDYEVESAIDAARASGVGWENLSLPRKAVIVDLIFNLGAAGFEKFVNTRTLIERGNFAEAGRALMHSKWAGQVKSRAKHLVTMLQDDIDFETMLEKLYG